MVTRSIGYHHVDWLRLVPTSGPFITLPVLKEAFRDGLDPVPREAVAALREELDLLRDDPGRRITFARWVLGGLLGLDEVLREGPAIPLQLAHTVAEHGVTLRPDAVVVDPAPGTPHARVLITLLDPGLDALGRIPGERWNATPADRMALLLRATGVRLGLVTDGLQWVLVSTVTPATGTASWNAELWLEERRTLDAFVSLLGARRLFGVAAEQRLEALLERSAGAQAEVTGQLGKQVRQAVELLVDAFSAADRRTGGRLLASVSEEEVYAAAVTVMMRLVFLLYAEERRLFPRDDDLYGSAYAASTLLEELTRLEDREGADALDRRATAWGRLLALFRVVHGGVQHEDLRLPAYGGSLFDPDRHPFLEGRPTRQTPRPEALPIRVSDLTVRLILDALQVLTFGEGGVREARRLSFRSLDVEQIGHVYEGLLDHGALRVTAVHVGLGGRLSPEIGLADLEEWAAQGADHLAARVTEVTGMTDRQVARGLQARVDDDRRRLLRTACEGDDDLVERVLPFAELVRDDARGLPTVFLPGSMYVTKSSERRSSGAYYTPRTLAEEMVVHALEPLVYAPGPQDTENRSAWRLRSAAEILDLTVCDMAMGSGAFLVAATRHLAGWLIEAEDGGARPATGSDAEDDTVVDARRRVVDRCIYGVDRNPMAVEMAKLSLWLVTLSKDRPFSFLDHALRPGDSLLGLTSPEQITCVHIDPARGREIHEGRLFADTERLAPLLQRAMELRRRLAAIPTRTVRDAEEKAALHAEAQDCMGMVRLVADLVVGAALSTVGQGRGVLDRRLIATASDLGAVLEQSGSDRDDGFRLRELADRAAYWLDEGRPVAAPPRAPLHWVLEFPEVFVDTGRPGFDAVVGNPPFLGGKRISGPFGVDYREYLVRHIADGTAGNADLVAYMFLRASQVSSSIALLATNTIAQGDTREVALDRLLGGGWTVYRATKSVPWPGEATLEVAQVWMTHGPWQSGATLDGASVRSVTPSLDPASRAAGVPHRLAANAGRSFQGSIVLGMGFVMSPDEAQRLIERDPRNRDVLFPYLNGEDLNTSPSQSASRWIIDFRERSESEARCFSDCWEIVERLVRPERIGKDTTRYPRMVHEWWKYWNARPGLCTAIANLTRVLALTRHTKVVQPVFVGMGQVYSDATTVFAYDDDFHFGVLTSAVHWWWAVTRASTLETRIRYTPTDCFETFPQPEVSPRVEAAGRALDSHRSQLMTANHEGLTRTYNRVHDPADATTGIAELRALHVELDHAVRDAYGWSDLDLIHAFHDTPQGRRFTVGPAARAEILDRLLELNHQRHAEEQAQVVPQRRTPGRRRIARPDADAAELPLLEVAEEPNV